MTKQELQTFEYILKERGYRKYRTLMNDADYAWFKSFGESKYEEDRSNYKVAFSIYDFSPYISKDINLKENPYSCSPSILLSRCIDERMDLEISSIAICKTNIEYIENLAQSFYEWADKNVKL